MKTVIVRSDAEFARAYQDHHRDGWGLAAVSNAGLEKGTARLTFLPLSAFTDAAPGAKPTEPKGLAEGESPVRFAEAPQSLSDPTQTGDRA